MSAIDQVAAMMMWLRARLGHATDEGSVTLETVIVAAVLSAAAIAATALIVNAITSHASQIK